MVDEQADHVIYPRDVTPPKDLWFQDCQRRVTCFNFL